MNIFFIGQRCVRKLSLSSKIFLVAGLFFVPVMVLLMLLSLKYTETIIFTQSEIQGLHLIQAVEEPWLLARQHRRITQKTFNDSSKEIPNLKTIESDYVSAWNKSKFLIKSNITSNQKIE